jgi:hypothetical protein
LHCDFKYDFKNIFAKTLAKILAFFAKTTASFLLKYENNIGFGDKRHFFPSKIGKDRTKL